MSYEMDAADARRLDEYFQLIGTQLKNRKKRESSQVMAKHDEQLLWHVNRRLNVHTRMVFRSALAVMVFCTIMMAACTVVFYQGSRLQEQVHVLLTAEAPPLPPRLTAPTATLPRRNHADQ